MKVAARYNRVNIITSIVVLIVTGIVYYLVIHLILTNKLDKDLAVEEDEIKQYTATYGKLPLPASFLEQQISYHAVKSNKSSRVFSYHNYYNAKKRKVEPGRSLLTSVMLKGKVVNVMITKSRVEEEDLVRIILLITLTVTILVLLSLVLINRFLLNRLWKPFYSTLQRMKAFDIARIDEVNGEQTGIDEFNELNKSVNSMAASVRKDYKELKNFTDNAAHEMMTPLAVINSKLDSLVQTGSFTEQQSLLLSDIYHAIGKLSRLHQSLLLLAKIENNLIADKQSLDLDQMVVDKLRQFQELFDKEQIEVNVNLQPVKLDMSKYLADILLNNLFSNAVRHNVSAGRISVVLTMDSFTISNTSKSSQIHQNIFDRFSRSATSEGMGLGLAISKQICNLYGFDLVHDQKDNSHSFSIVFQR